MADAPGPTSGHSFMVISSSTPQEAPAPLREAVAHLHAKLCEEEAREGRASAPPAWRTFAELGEDADTDALIAEDVASLAGPDERAIYAAGYIAEHTLKRIKDASLVLIHVADPGEALQGAFLLGMRIALTAKRTIVAHASDALVACPDPFRVETIDLGLEETDFAKKLADLTKVTVHVSRHTLEWTRNIAQRKLKSPPPAQIIIYAPPDHDPASGEPVFGVRVGDVKEIGKYPADPGVDIWVNTENDAMEMARVTDSSVSAAIRFLGARWRGPNRDHSNDAIYRDLVSELGRRRKVNFGEVLVTRVRQDTPLAIA
ncbi:MAG: hypothetical protein MI723_04815, partial [Caulobacterales bacterium]|nr:hypothetical protein [Caulobacterales bacterium]